jgi:hypothetical protein
LDRQRECHRLADAVNPLLADIELLGGQTQPSARGYGELAERYRSLRIVVGRLNLKDPRLNEAVDAYLEMVVLAEKQLKQAVNPIGPADKVDDKELLRRQQVAMSAVMAQQTTVQGRLRGLCKP